MTKLIRFGLVAAVVVSLLAADSAFAQIRRRVREREGVVEPGVAVNTGGYVMVPQTPWYSSPGVRAQLKLDTNQYNQLNNAYNQYWNTYNQGVVGLGTTLTPDQRTAQMNQLYGTFYTNFDQTRNQVLNDQALRDRYNQLHWQYQGYGAFNDPTVRERLALTPDQYQKFQGYYNTSNQELAKLRQEYATNPDAATRDYNAWRAQSQQQINSTLTPQQRQQWTNMIGQPYEFQAQEYLGAHANAGVQGTAPRTTAPQSTVPQGTAPQGTTPQGAPPSTTPPATPRQQGTTPPATPPSTTPPSTAPTTPPATVPGTDIPKTTTPPPAKP